MGKQSAKIYYQGKYYSDILCETDSPSGMPSTNGRVFINNSQMYIGNKLVWERKPADLIFLSDIICVSNDLVHCSSMQTAIDDSKSNNSYTPVYFCTFSKQFVCAAQGDGKLLFLRSKDGFKWQKFYETDGVFRQGYTNQYFIECKCGSIDCIAVCIQDEIKYFDLNFVLVKTIKSNLDPNIIPLTLVGGETLYLYGKTAVADNGIMEEYANGELTIRHEFTYQESFFRDYLYYIRDEDAVYSVSAYGKFLVANMYIHGKVYPIETADASTIKSKYYVYPYMSQELLILYFYDNGLYNYFELKNGILYFKFKSEYILNGKRDGITSYSYFDETSKERNVFTKDDFFYINFKNQKPVEVKGIRAFYPENINEFAYIERQ